LTRTSLYQPARTSASIGVVGIGLVGPHIKRALGLPSIKAYHRQPTFTQFRPEPGGQRPGLEADPNRTGACLHFLQILLVHFFEKVRLSCAFQSVDDSNRDPSPANQLNKRG
jgi:hypothetical protein